MAVDAIILAGAPAEPDMKTVDGYTSRAMVAIGSKTMLQYVVDALKGSQLLGRIIAVGDVTADGLDEVLEPAGGFLENMMKGLDKCDPKSPVLVMSSDIPLITPDGVDSFLKAAMELNADMAYPIITKESCMAKYPDMKRTYVKTAEGTFTGGNMLLMNSSFLRKNEKNIADAYAARKKPLALAAMIGYGTLMRLVLAQTCLASAMPIRKLEGAVSKMLGGVVKAIITSDPEIGEDVDKASDLEAVRAILEGRS